MLWVDVLSELASKNRLILTWVVYFFESYQFPLLISPCDLTNSSMSPAKCVISWRLFYRVRFLWPSYQGDDGTSCYLPTPSVLLVQLSVWSLDLGNWLKLKITCEELPLLCQKYVCSQLSYHCCSAEQTGPVNVVLVYRSTWRWVNHVKYGLFLRVWFQWHSRWYCCGFLKEMVAQLSFSSPLLHSLCFTGILVTAAGSWIGSSQGSDKRKLQNFYFLISFLWMKGRGRGVTFF